MDTRHASERQDERRINRPEILYVLKNGHHEKKKDKFDNFHCAWNYAVRGKTVDRRELRMKWEKTLNKSTAMNWSSEKDIRLFILTRLAVKAQELASLYGNLEVLPEGKPEPIHLDAKQIAA